MQQLNYVEELEIYEVGVILGAAIGRALQFKKAAIERLRDLIRESIGGDE